MSQQGSELLGRWGIIDSELGILERSWSNFFSKFLHLLGSLCLTTPRNRGLCTYKDMPLYLWTMYDNYLSWRLPPGNFPHQHNGPLTSFTKAAWCILPLFSVRNSPLLFLILCGTWFLDVNFCQHLSWSIIVSGIGYSNWNVFWSIKSSVGQLFPETKA